MSGEHPNGRKAMDDLQRRLVESGVNPKRAEDLARESARRVDKQRNS